jgi:hypothetical protein
LPGRSNEIQFDLRIRFLCDRLASHQDEVDRLEKFVLMAAKHFAHQTTRARTRDRVAYFAGSDNAKARSPLPFFRIRAPPIKYQATFDDALAFQPSAFKFPAPLQALRLREPERFPGWSLACHVNTLRIKPGSGACGQRDGDWPGHRDRSW